MMYCRYGRALPQRLVPPRRTKLPSRTTTTLRLVSNMRVNMPQNRKKAGFFMADMLDQISKKPSAKISKILWVLWEIQTDMVTSGLLDCKKKGKNCLKHPSALSTSSVSRLHRSTSSELSFTPTVLCRRLSLPFHPLMDQNPTFPPKQMEKNTNIWGFP